MRFRGSQRNLRGGSSYAAQEIVPMTEQSVQRDS